MNDFGSILGTEPSVESYTNESQISIVEIDWKLREFKIVRKYLTRNIKELSNVHICVLGCLLGLSEHERGYEYYLVYCSA